MDTDVQVPRAQGRAGAAIGYRFVCIFCLCNKHIDDPTLATFVEYRDQASVLLINAMFMDEQAAGAGKRTTPRMEEVEQRLEQLPRSPERRFTWM